jgi:ABC-type Fe3+/spermidine/putrescine transport system ATPase subunit
MTQTTEKPTAPLLDLLGLDLRYGEFRALKGVSLSVAKGEFVALLGPSGCGKTSILRSIAGFVHPDRGQILLDGRDISAVPPRRRNIGLVFQTYALFPHMSVRDNVGFGLECRGVRGVERNKRVDWALELVDLTVFADRRPRQLSGGQQQRVALARALVIEPDLLLLDEPLGALDKKLRSQMQAELRELQQRLGLTTILVTHDHEEALSLADRVVVMREGEIVQTDRPHALFSAPQSDYVAAFLGVGNILQGARVTQEGDLWHLDVAPGCSFPLKAAAPPPRAAKLYVRADRVVLSRAEPGARGGTIRSRRFLGLHEELLVDFADAPLRVLMSSEAARDFPVGIEVTATADPAHCSLID